MSKTSISFKHRENLYNHLKFFSSRPKWTSEYIPELNDILNKESSSTAQMIKFHQAHPKLQKIVDLISLGYLKNITQSIKDSVDEVDPKVQIEIAEFLSENSDKGNLLQITAGGWSFMRSFEEELRQEELIKFEKSNAKKIRVLTFLLFLVALTPALYYFMKIFLYLSGETSDF